MDDDYSMTFQAVTDDRLMRAVVRRALLPSRIGGTVILLVVALVAKLAGYAEVAGCTLAGAVFAAVFSWFNASNVVDRIRPQAWLPAAYRIDRSGITIAAGFSTTVVEWSTVTGVRQWRGQIALFLGWRKVIGIPTGSLTAEERARLLSLLRSRGATAVSSR